MFGGELTAGDRTDGTRLPRTGRAPRVLTQWPKLRVLIADDQPLMRAGFRAVLEASGEMEVVAEASDGLEAVAAARACRPDVVLMDVRMPNLDGIEAIRRLPAHRVLVLTTFGLDEYIVEALRAGASGFVTKDIPAESSCGPSGSSPPAMCC